MQHAVIRYYPLRQFNISAASQQKQNHTAATMQKYATANQIIGQTILFERNPMILQLNPPIPILTPKGKALAHILIDYGPEEHLLWVCFQNDTGECWTWANDKIRAQANPTMGRPVVPPIPPVKNDG